MPSKLTLRIGTCTEFFNNNYLKYSRDHIDSTYSKMQIMCNLGKLHGNYYCGKNQEQKTSYKLNSLLILEYN